MKMVHLFRPSEGKWKLSDDGIVLFDPRHPDRVAQVLPVRKRDQERIWLLLPFTGGASGIGMKRVSEDEMTKAQASSAQNTPKPRKSPQPWDAPSE